MLARRRPVRPGLTLLEVLLALAIFLMSIVAIGRLVDVGTDNAAAAAYQSAGARLAQSKLAEVECGLIPVNGGSSGTIEDEPGWEFTIETSPTDATNVYLVTATLTRTAGRRHTVSLSQMIHDPQMMGTAAAAQKPETTSTATGTAATGGTSP